MDRVVRIGAESNAHMKECGAEAQAAPVDPEDKETKRHALQQLARVSDGATGRNIWGYGERRAT